VGGIFNSIRWRNISSVTAVLSSDISSISKSNIWRWRKRIMVAGVSKLATAASYHVSAYGSVSGERGEISWRGQLSIMANNLASISVMADNRRISHGWYLRIWRISVVSSVCIANGGHLGHQ